MGEAKRNRETAVALGPTDLDKKAALNDELRRIDRQRNGDALNTRRRIGGIPQEAWPKKKVRR